MSVTQESRVVEEPEAKVLPLRVVTAASLFDGHDAAINVMRRLIQGTGAEVIHLGHNRSVSDEYPVARYLRDAKVFQIVEGNNQLHKSLVASAALGLDR